MKIMNVVGARPNFVKIAPLIREMNKRKGLEAILVHTGQHYDDLMATQFFEDLNISLPGVSLEVGPGSHAIQTGEVMKRLEPILERENPDVVIVVGDVNSTVAAALTAVKLQIPVAHVEAGLRSFDRTMPEEINRIVTDAVAHYLFVTEESGVLNLKHEGVPEERIFFTGNVMIDALQETRHAWERSSIKERLGVRKGEYGVMTLHRPSNVDDPARLQAWLKAIHTVAQQVPIIFPVHPRTQKHLVRQAVPTIEETCEPGQPVPSMGVRCLQPLGYLDFMCLVSGARIVLTDSGGLQEETTVLGIPCLTLRDNTERPVTVTHGTNRLVGGSPEKLVSTAMEVLRGPTRVPAPPPMWDGKASQRIVDILFKRAGRKSLRVRR
jgi:UDP-N-acetylglucosamine 2-epimerase (non-hydrolysing)